VVVAVNNWVVVMGHSDESESANGMNLLFEQETRHEKPFFLGISVDTLLESICKFLQKKKK
tara:strand:- start:87 stop:269 length:183 start_codon:yes stop_codon:yes gene_type:complete